MTKQKAHAKVLGQVRAELVAAADEMDKALVAEGIHLAARVEGPGTPTSDSPSK